MDQFILELSVLLVVAASLSCIAVLCKQPIVVAYILCGVLIGPWGTGWVNDVEFISHIAHLGITLLLFLTGLCLHPQKLVRVFKKTFFVTAAVCTASFGLGFVFSQILQFNLIESLCVGLALMFSSTILTIKLLPTNDLHHKRMGAVCIGVLILEDLLAIAVMAFIRSIDAPQGLMFSFVMLSLKLVLFITALALFEQFILRRVMARVERYHEVLFVLGLAWCFGVASIAHAMGLFYETGAFFAGVIMARQPLSLFISLKLKPLRDFFLVLFFFAMGARMDILIMKQMLLPSLILAALFVMFKPMIFKRIFMLSGEDKDFAQESGIRLGQLSEFSLLVAFLAFNLGHIGSEASQLIQLTTIFTFIASSYIVVYRYPSPIGPSSHLTRE